MAGSPDGIVTTSEGDTGLIEIKNLLHSKPLNLWQAASGNKNFCLEIMNGKLQLKKLYLLLSVSWTSKCLRQGMD